MKILEILTKKRLIGNIGEKAAVRFLKRHGYKICEKNFVAAGYEIDVIAANKEFIVFCEVKTRTLGHESPKEPRPASAVTPDKQKKIITASKHYFSDKFKGRKMRYDIIEVFVDEAMKIKQISHLESAFNYNTAHRS